MIHYFKFIFLTLLPGEQEQEQLLADIDLSRQSRKKPKNNAYRKWENIRQMNDGRNRFLMRFLLGASIRMQGLLF